MPESNFPDVSCLRGHTTTPSYAMIPLMDLIADGRLSHRDFRVFAVIAAHRPSKYNPFVSIGERRIGLLAHIDRRGVRDSVAKLIKCGHIENIGSKHGNRARYRLTHPLYVGKWTAEVAPETPEIAGLSSQVVESKDCASGAETALIRCPKCRKHCRQLLNVGYCRACKKDDKLNWKIRGVVREELAKAEVA